MRSYRFNKLPESMQVLIWQLSKDYDKNIVIPKILTLGKIPVAGLPNLPVGIDPLDERDVAYALSMDLFRTPPILIANNIFLDGKHRVYAARIKNISELDAIDLTGIVPIKSCQENGMGPVTGFRI